MTTLGNHEYPPQWWEPSTSQVSHRLEGPRLTIMLAGELDAFTSTAIYQRVRDIVTTSTFDRVILDLADVDFCDCAGARTLIAMHFLATDRGATCVVHHLQNHIAWLIRELRAPATLVIARRVPADSAAE